MDLVENIIETWTINHRVSLYLLENIDEAWLPSKLGEKGWSIGEQFVHINNIRSMWINKVGEKIDLKIKKNQSTKKVALTQALNLSGTKMAETLSNVLSENTIKGYKPHPISFFGQMIAHESHHRGQIMATITRHNLEISKSVNYGLWSWSSR